MADLDSADGSSRDVGRDSRGRFVPGSSGNPAGRGPGRPPEEVNRLADQAIDTVLRHDMDVVRRATEPEEGEEKPTRTEVQKALDRLSRVGARRVTTRTETDVSVITPELRAINEEFGRTLSAEQVELLERIEAMERPKLGSGAARRSGGEGRRG